MPEQKQLKHPEFWEQMKRATQQVERWPDWEKGSPTNQRSASQPTQTQVAKCSQDERSR